MRLYECDKCKCPIEKRYVGIPFTIKTEQHDYFIKHSGRIELCKKCEESFKKWLNGGE